jgi:hypothetical protein
VVVTGLPVPESGQVIAGYAMYDVPSAEVAVEWTRRFMDLHRQAWPAWDGESEIRQVFGPEG